MPPPIEVGGISAEQIREQIEKIRSSNTFRNVPRQRQLLEFIIEERLAGRQEEIKGPVIADALYEGDEAKMRPEVRRMRANLLAYYHSEGRLDAVRIEVPRGRYLPKFSWNRPPDLQEQPSKLSPSLPIEQSAEQPSAPAVHPNHGWWAPLRFFTPRRAGRGIAAVAVLALAAYLFKPSIAAPITVAPPNPERPFAATFTFKNNNPFAIRDVQFQCAYPYLSFDSEFKDGRMNVPIPDRAERVEPGRGRTFVCPWALVTKLHKFLGAPAWVDLDKMPVSKSGLLKLTVNQQSYDVRLPEGTNNLHGLYAALNKYDVVTALYSFKVTLSGQPRTMYGFYLLVPEDHLTLMDGDLNLVSSRPSEEDERLKEIQTSVSISYRYLLWPRLQETFYYETRITQRDGVYFGAITKGDIGRNYDKERAR